jgi:hypothetical protein
MSDKAAITTIAVLLAGLAVVLLFGFTGDDGHMAPMPPFAVSGPPGSLVILHEGNPEWIPRVPDSTGKVVLKGECGQFDGGHSFHRIECPK